MLQALKLKYMDTSEVGKTLYAELRANIVDNMVNQYVRKGYIYEQYDDNTGEVICMYVDIACICVYTDMVAIWHVYVCVRICWQYGKYCVREREREREIFTILCVCCVFFRVLVIWKILGSFQN